LAFFLGGAAPAAVAALAASFAGFGFGSYLLGRFAPRLRRPLRAFAILEISTVCVRISRGPAAPHRATRSDVAV
jgi:hypothetical protein